MELNLMTLGKGAVGITALVASPFVSCVSSDVDNVNAPVDGTSSITAESLDEVVENAPEIEELSGKTPREIIDGWFEWMDYVKNWSEKIQNVNSFNTYRLKKEVTIYRDNLEKMMNHFNFMYADWKKRPQEYPPGKIDWDGTAKSLWKSYNLAKEAAARKDYTGPPLTFDQALDLSKTAKVFLGYLKEINTLHKETFEAKYGSLDANPQQK